MRRISDTIARLAALQARQGSSPATPNAPGRLSPLSGFGSNPGALKGWSYVPEGLSPGSPLVVVLHGCTQTAAGYDHHSGWSKLADEAGFAVLYPEQQRANNSNLCFNWFQPGDVARGGGEALSIHQMIEALTGAHALDRDRIYVTGLSAGGAMAGAMLASYPDVFAAGAIVSGLAYGTAVTVPQAFDRMRGHGGPSQESLRRLLRDASEHRGPWPRVSVWQGDQDRTVDVSNANAIIGQWWGVHQVQSAPTHSVTRGRHQQQAWCDDRGTAVLELNIIAAMGHGTPIDPDRLGAAGPYMLDVGISSTHAIAQFWGIVDAQAEAAAMRNRSAGAGSAGAAEAGGQHGADDQQQGARQPETQAGGVQKIIEDALRSAGLMR